MKNKRKSSLLSIPRSGSLLHRLQHAPKPEEGALPYLEQLMIFLEDPPSGVRDRWKKGAKMCAAWGFPCSAPAVWRLYRSHVIEWRLRLAQAADIGAGKDEKLWHETVRLMERRAYQALTDPELSHDSVAGFVRLELRRQSLQVERARQEDNRVRGRDLALELLGEEVDHNPEAREAFKKLRIALGKPPEEPEPKIVEHEIPNKPWLAVFDTPDYT